MKMFTFFVALQFITFSLAIELDFTIEVLPAKRECFHQTISNGVAVDVEYQVIDGGELDINFMVKNPGGQIMITDVRKTENYHKFTASMDGDYEFCLDNTFSRYSDKIVFFELMTDENNEQVQLDMDYDMESNYEMKIEDFRDAIYDIHYGIEQYEGFLMSRKAKEMRDSYLVRANFDRVNFWSLINLMVMIGTALAQVYMIRRLFKTDDVKSRPSASLCRT